MKTFMSHKEKTKFHSSGRPLRPFTTKSTRLPVMFGDMGVYCMKFGALHTSHLEDFPIVKLSDWLMKASAYLLLLVVPEQFMKLWQYAGKPTARDIAIHVTVKINCISGIQRPHNVHHFVILYLSWLVVKRMFWTFLKRTPPLTQWLEHWELHWRLGRTCTLNCRGVIFLVGDESIACS